MYIQSEISVSRLCNGKEQKGCIHPGSRKVEKESQRQTEETNFPKSRQKLRYCVLQHKGIYARMARLLRNSGDEMHNGRMELLAAQKDTNVYLEAMEITKDKGEEPDKTWNARVASLQKRKYTKGLLGCCRQWNTATHHNKRKTCTPWIL